MYMLVHSSNNTKYQHGILCWKLYNTCMQISISFGKICNDVNDNFNLQTAKTKLMLPGHCRWCTVEGIDLL